MIATKRFTAGQNWWRNPPSLNPLPLRHTQGTCRLRRGQPCRIPALLSQSTSQNLPISGHFSAAVVAGRLLSCDQHLHCCPSSLLVRRVLHRPHRAASHLDGHLDGARSCRRFLASVLLHAGPSIWDAVWPQRSHRAAALGVGDGRGSASYLRLRAALDRRLAWVDCALCSPLFVPAVLRL